MISGSQPCWDTDHSVARLDSDGVKMSGFDQLGGHRALRRAAVSHWPVLTGARCGCRCRLRLQYRKGSSPFVWLPSSQARVVVVVAGRDYRKGSSPFVWLPMAVLASRRHHGGPMMSHTSGCRALHTVHPRLLSFSQWSAHVHHWRCRCARMPRRFSPATQSQPGHESSRVGVDGIARLHLRARPLRATL